MNGLKTLPSLRTAIVGLGLATFLSCAAPLARATVIYRGLQNIPIPTDFSGVYLNIENGANSAEEFAGWDINPFFGGVGVGNSASFQPARTGSGNEAPLLTLGVGAPVGENLIVSSGQGGSSTHLGSGPTQFGIGQEAYLGFRFFTDGNTGPFHGWMRVIFTANTSGGVLKDWAYETTGLATEAGNVQQNAPVAGVSTVTLSGGPAQEATLGPLPGGGSLAIVKTGEGIWNLSAPGSYSSLTTSGGLTRVQTSLTNASILADTGSTIHLETSQTLAALNVVSEAVVELASSTLGSAPPPSAMGVPEPGSAALLASACAMMLARRRATR